MPFVHVRSLPVAGDFDAEDAVRAISTEFAARTDVDEQHVTVTWQTLEPGHYASGGETARAQPVGSHPVLVELFAPDSNSDERIEQMLLIVARAVAAQAGVEPENVFVHFRPARSGEVFDGGQVGRW
jgi:phenylpyruvate tautomerase PptA (4-oxalocrotonate tautomerase family)